MQTVEVILLKNEEN